MTGYSMRYQDKEPTPRRSSVTNPALALVEPAFQLGQHAPLLAGRTLARSLKQQTRGGQLAAARAFFTALVTGSNGDPDHYLAQEILAELKKL